MLQGCQMTSEDKEKLAKLFVSGSDKENAADLISGLMNDPSASSQLANVLELVDRIAKSGVNNGVALFDSTKFNLGNDVCLETLIASYLLKKHELKRVLILNLNREPASRLQRTFYSDHK